MRLGLIARADNSGLGIQTWEFYRHMEPAKTLVVDISGLNGNQIFPERYPTNARIVGGFPNSGTIDEFLEDLDCVFVAEAAYNPYLYTRARELGVKTAVQYNYEFMDWLINPTYPKPDMLIAPSQWRFQNVQSWCDAHQVKHVYLHCPVARDKLPFVELTHATTFLHPAGRAAAHDRNGTETVIRASKHLKTNAFIVIHFQGEQGLSHQATKTVADYERHLREHGDPTKVNIVKQEFDNYQDIYGMGDVLLLPRRYGGNCLPLNEALSKGMPVIMTDISPNNRFLPSAWLLPAERVAQFAPRTIIDIYEADPEALAAKIDEFYAMTADEIKTQQAMANALADTISWEAMKPKYLAVFEELCTQS